MPCGGAAYGDSNLVFIANDWHTALLPVYLQVSDSESCPLRVPYVRPLRTAGTMPFCLCISVSEGHVSCVVLQHRPEVSGGVIPNAVHDWLSYSCSCR